MAKRPGPIVFGSDRKGSKSSPVPASVSPDVVSTNRSDVCSAAPLVAEDSPADTQSLIGTDGDVSWRRPGNYRSLPKPTQDLADAVGRRNAQLDQQFPSG